MIVSRTLYTAAGRTNASIGRAAYAARTAVIRNITCLAQTVAAIGTHRAVLAGGAALLARGVLTVDRAVQLRLVDELELENIHRWVGQRDVAAADVAHRVAATLFDLDIGASPLGVALSLIHI